MSKIEIRKVGITDVGTDAIVNAAMKDFGPAAVFAALFSKPRA